MPDNTNTDSNDKSFFHNLNVSSKYVVANAVDAYLNLNSAGKNILLDMVADCEQIPAPQLSIPLWARLFDADTVKLIVDPPNDNTERHGYSLTGEYFSKSMMSWDSETWAFAKRVSGLGLAHQYKIVATGSILINLSLSKGEDYISSSSVEKGTIDKVLRRELGSPYHTYQTAALYIARFHPSMKNVLDMLPTMSHDELDMFDQHLEEVIKNKKKSVRS